MTTITREHIEDEVLRSIQQKAVSIMPKDARVILFGSRARKDAKADSDWDILVLLDKDKIEEQDHDDYTYPFWDLGWRIDQMIHPIVYSMKDWQSKKGSPFYNNVEKEGGDYVRKSTAKGSCKLFVHNRLSAFILLQTAKTWSSPYNIDRESMPIHENRICIF